MTFRNQAKRYGIPEIGYMRLRYIIGDSKVDPPIPAVIPVCASTWWAGIKVGRYPKPVKLAPNVTAWRVEEIRELIDRINDQRAGE